LSFEPRRGRRFISDGKGYKLLLTSTEATIRFRIADFGLRIEADGEKQAYRFPGRPNKNPKFENRNSKSAGVLRMQLLGAKASARAFGADALPGKANYFIGNDPKKWRTDITTYSKVRYEGIYPGIDAVYYGNQQTLEYDFEISPGRDPGVIRVGFSRNVKPRIDENGDLVLQIAGIEVHERKPLVYQDIGGVHRPVEGGYVMRSAREVGFEIGPYDKTKLLVIDPALVYSTYLGGAGDDTGSSIAVDRNGNIYVAGVTASTNFPVKNAFQPSKVGLSDVFVTKIDATGSNIVYSTYVGGSGLNRADGLAIDDAGNAYVVGRVDSTSKDFPTTTGAFSRNYNGGDFDGVVFKLNPSGNGLVYSTFLGGSDNDSAEGITVDSAGNAYVTGGTRSPDFPTTANAYQGSHSGNTTAYLTKFNSTGTALLYSTYLSGSATERGAGVAVDSNGNAYVAGYTSSADFPTVNAFQNSLAGNFDAFIAKINTNAGGAASLVFSSYLGGFGDDRAFGVALDAGANNAYIVGQTSSNNFPVLNAAQPNSGGNFDAFIAKISSSGAKVYATYLGGSGDDKATGVGVSPAGSVYVTGFTASTNFPTVAPIQIANGGGYDAFVAKLSAAGDSFLYATYLGGSGNENSVASVTSTNPIAVDSASNVYVTGYTSSSNFPTRAPLQAANAGGEDAFIAKLSDIVPPQTANPIDDAQFFVRQHYFDFLSREPDAAGWAYWTNEITKCGTDQGCVNDRRISVSAAFFMSTEFGQTGSFVYRLYKGALGRQPSFAEFIADRSRVIGGADILSERTALANDFVQRPEFKQIYPDSMTNSQFVNTLFDTAGLIPFTTERQQEIDAMNAGKTRAQVVQDVIEIQAFKNRELNPSFVLMQYFGYLRRDKDQAGYDFWLNVLNNRDPNNYRGMVCSFITSAEYQLRFGPVVTSTNAQCAGVQ
jgi:hypothetical protein